MVVPLNAGIYFNTNLITAEFCITSKALYRAYILLYPALSISITFPLKYFKAAAAEPEHLCSGSFSDT